MNLVTIGVVVVLGLETRFLQSVTTVLSVSSQLLYLSAVFLEPCMPCVAQEILSIMHTLATVNTNILFFQERYFHSTYTCVSISQCLWALHSYYCLGQKDFKFTFSVKAFKTKWYYKSSSM